MGVGYMYPREPGNIGTFIGRLAQLGHRRVGFMSWHYSVGGRWASRRFASYAEGIFQHGLEFSPEWTINSHKDRPTLLTREAVADEVAKLTRSAGVTAWVCAADHQAYPLIADLRARGLRVPEDCSITGFDGIEPPTGMTQVATLSVAHADNLGVGDEPVAQSDSAPDFAAAENPRGNDAARWDDAGATRRPCVAALRFGARDTGSNVIISHCGRAGARPS